jgi:putative transposase
MLKNPQFQEWCNRLELSKRSRELVSQIRDSEPIRRVGGRANNVCGRYPSQKMGWLGRGGLLCPAPPS